MNNSILRPFLGKWLDEKPALINKQTGFLIILVFIAIASFSYVNYFQSQNRSRAALACPLATSPDKVHGKIVLTPTSSEYIYDCSGVDVIIASDGEVVVGSYVNGDGAITGDYGAQIIFNNLTVESGGRIVADSQGYKPNESDGSIGNAVAGTDNVGGSGGGYGGAGGEGRSNGLTLPGKAGDTFGSIYNPVFLGGAGGDSGTADGGNGGGAVRIIVNGTLNLDGIISSNGGKGNLSTDNTTSSGGGAGGSVWINAGLITGSGSVTANGGSSETATYEGGGGGGGRIIMECTTGISFTGSVTANNGIGAQNGQAGSIIGPGCIPATPTVVKTYEGNGSNTRQIPQAGYTTNNTVTIFADLVDPNANATVRLQVEVRAVNEEFTGVPTNTQTAYVSNPKSCSGTNDCGTVTITGLTVSKQYKYRVRATNSTNVSSDWLDVGGNGNNADFTISGTPAGFIKTSGDNQTGEVGKQVAATLKAQLIDANSFPVPIQTVAWQVMTGNGTLLNKITTTDDNGYVTSDWVLGTVSGTNNNTVKISNSSTSNDSTFSASANAGPISRFTVVSDQVVTLGSNFTFNVNALDQYNNQTPFAGTVNAIATAVDGTTPGSGTLTPASFDVASGTYTTSTASYSVNEVIRIKVDDGNGHTGTSNTVVVASSMGNCPDVDIDNNQEWKAADASGGIYDCRGLGAITIREGVTLTLTSYDSGDTNYGNDYGVTVLADGVNILATAVVNANGKGYLDGHGPGYGSNNGSAYGGYSQSGTAPVGDVYEPFLMGSGGIGTYGSIGYGGGAIKFITTSDFTNNGIVQANALYDGNAGGGTGGSIWLDVANLNGTGSFTANGSNSFSNWASNASGGSGGRIAIYYTGGNYPLDNMDKIQARGFSSAGPGTIYIEKKGLDVNKGAHLYIDNNNVNGQPAGLLENTYEFMDIHQTRYGHLKVLGQNSVLELTSGAAMNGDSTKSSLIVEGTINYTGAEELSINGVDLKVAGRLQGVSDFVLGNSMIGGMTLYAHTWYYNNTTPHSFENVEIGPNGILTLVSYDSGDTVYTNDYLIEFDATNVQIDAGGKINGDGTGYQEGRGIGYGSNNGSAYGGYSQNGTAPVGDVYEPTLLGSGGIGTYGSVGHGGAAIKMNVSGTLTNNGTLSANALYSGNSGGGTGGSLWLIANQIDGTGTISANGSASFSNWASNAAGGSGGRIAIYYNSGNFPLTNMDKVTARGYSAAGPGTIYLEQVGVDTSKGAHLYIDNNGNNGQSAGLLEGNYKFMDIHQTRYGHLKVLGQNSVLEITAGAALNGDSTKSSLTVNGTINYSGSGRLYINGVDLTVSGKLQGVTDFTLGNTLIGGMTLNAHTWYYNNTVPYNFNDIEIGANGILTLVSYDSGDTNYTNDYLIELDANNITIDAGGKINGDGKGYQEGRGIGYGGGNGSAYGGYSQNGIVPVGNVYEPSLLGSGGVGSYGYVAHGGAAIKMNVSGILTVNGTLSANAVYSGGNAGGSTGGSIWLNTNQIDGTGNISANGSTSFSNWATNAAGGSGGRIAIYYQKGNFPVTNMDKVMARGYSSAGSGTIYLEQVGVDDSKGAHLYIDNNGSNGQSAGLLEGNYKFMDIHQTRYGHLKVLGQNGILEITSGAALNGDGTKPALTVDGTINYTGSGRLYINGIDLTVSGRLQGVTDFTLGDAVAGGMTLFAKTWYYNSTTTHSYGDVEVGAYGTLTLTSYDSGDTNYQNDYPISIDANNITIDAGGKITGDGKGYQEGRGIGYGSSNGSAYGGYSQSGTAPVGDVYEPTLLGSGGIGSYGYVAHGGAAIKMKVTGTLTNNGVLSANAVYSGGNAGGSTGGSIWLNVNQITGNGSISANGSTSFSNWATNCSGGSGGRIAIYYNGGDFPLTNMDKVTARGYSSAGPGTIYLEKVGVDTSKGAHLYVDNNGSNGQSAGLLEGTYKFMDVHQTRYGHLKVLGQNSVLEITAGAALNGDSTKPALTVDGTINYTGSDRLFINGIDLTVSGRLQGVNDFTLGNAVAGGMTLFAKTWYYDDTTTHSYSNVEVGSKGILTLVAYNNGDSDYTNDYPISISLNSLLVDAGGLVTASGKGYTQRTGPGYGGSNGSGYGGYSAGGVSSIGDLYYPTMLGSGGVDSYGYAAHGGGAVVINTDGNFTLNGGLEANALFTSGNAGGGTGGSIIIKADKLTGNGTIKANGAAGFSNWATNCSGGSGGRIAILVNSTDFPYTQTTNVQVSGAGGAGPGTIYVKDASLNTQTGSLYIIGNSGRSMDFSPVDWDFNNVYIGPNISVWMKSDLENNRGVLFNLDGNFTLASGAQILGNGMGYSSATGPGKGENATLQNGGGGAAHGGNGGNGESSDGVTLTLGGIKYDNQFYPLGVGSGGGLGGTGAAGGAGGGSVAIIAKDGAVNISGSITMNGTNGLTGSPGGGGGAGGAIIVYANSCQIDGNLSANGGNGGDSTFDGGGGGGGRVSVIKVYGECNVSGNVSVAMGSSSGGQTGQIGTYGGVVTFPQIKLESQNKISGEIIPVGGVISDDQLQFLVGVSDPGATESSPIQLMVDLELVDIDHDFSDTGEMIEMSSSNVPFYGGEPEMVNMLSDNGLQAGENYKWRARVVNVENGIVSEWQEYGDNGDEADFKIADVSNFNVEADKTEVNIGEPVGLTVTAIDSKGSVASDYNGIITFAYSPVSDPGADLPSNFKFSDSDNGTHSFVDELKFYSPGIYTINVSDTVNTGITGTSNTITVLAPVIPSVTDNAEETTVSPTATDNIPSVSPTTVAKSCEEDPNQTACQVNVKISDLTATVNDNDVKVCWQTNIPTVGLVSYGRTILSSATPIETVYSNEHCTEINDLEKDTSYNYEVNASSNAGKMATADGTFNIGKATTPEKPQSCILVSNYAFDTQANLLLAYETAYEATCSLTFRYLNDASVIAQNNEDVPMLHHSSQLDLNGLLGGKDLIYDISCDLKQADDVPDDIKECNFSGTIPGNKVMVYLPETGGDSAVSSIITKTMTVAGELLPYAASIVLIGAASGVTAQNSQILFYALFWLKRKKKSQAWGLIYDSLNNKPVPFAVIRLYDALGNKLLAEEVSSIDGKYNILTTPGKYQLAVEHSAYEKFQLDIELTSNDEQIAYTLPLKPSARLIKVSPKSIVKRIKLFLVKNNEFLVICGFLISLSATILSPVWFNYLVLVLYFAQELIIIMGRRIHWAVVRDYDNTEGVRGVFVKLFDTVQQRQLEVTLTDAKGRYKFLTNDGKYLAQVYCPGYRVRNSSANDFVDIEIKGGVTRTDIEIQKQ